MTRDLPKFLSNFHKIPEIFKELKCFDTKIKICFTFYRRKLSFYKSRIYSLCKFLNPEWSLMFDKFYVYDRNDAVLKVNQQNLRPKI